ncbi:hypothetical protein [Acetobacter oeni]|uniref:Uncharacterized protein n=1 Tax=Acetobacter oeni TaxID=304077 RepID=A0A511XH12_9PROT|nr:hypothetical protein [Acetobacter oeni]MBB3882375.1 hypothetical protein [Acetobacter oeni]NHO18523.1 hypothetical protein [Acetobacter oeni]GEN62235.1 hypothetical protein AOE01nite_04590 [Acetobacter oeni]
MLSGRRAFLTGTLSATIAGRTCTTASAATPQSQPPDVTTWPPRSRGGTASTGCLPDPDVIALDPSFKALTFSGTSIRRVLTGGGWLEGPTWPGEARLLLLSDTIRSEQYRCFIPPDGPGEGLS